MTITHVTERLADSEENLTESVGAPVASRLITYELTIINLALAAICLTLMPMSGWLSYERVGWALSQLPATIMLAVLPAGYSLYWQYGGLIAGLAAASCLVLYRRTRSRPILLLAAVNLACGIAFLISRLVLT